MLVMTRIDQVAPAFPLRSRPSERLYIDPQNELMAILYQPLTVLPIIGTVPFCLLANFWLGLVVDACV